MPEVPAAILALPQNFGPASVSYVDNIVQGCIVTFRAANNQDYVGKVIKIDVGSIDRGKRWEDLLTITFADRSRCTKVRKYCRRVANNTTISPQAP